MGSIAVIDILFNGIGVIGVGLILFAYFALERGDLKSDQLSYPVMNLVGAVLLLISLSHTPNIPSIIIELCWMAISIYGIQKILRRRNTQKNEQSRK